MQIKEMENKGPVAWYIGSSKAGKETKAHKANKILGFLLAHMSTSSFPCRP